MFLTFLKLNMLELLAARGSVTLTLKLYFKHALSLIKKKDMINGGSDGQAHEFTAANKNVLWSL